MELTHYGVLGMKWGVRKDRSATSFPAKARRKAKSDAKKWAEAKASYGEGAGIRRRKLRGRIEQRKKNSPVYSEAFEEALKKIDTEKAAIKADAWRTKQDAKKQAVRYTKKVLKIAGPFAAAAATAYVASHKDQIESFVSTHADDVVRRVQAEVLKRKIGAS